MSGNCQTCVKRLRIWVQRKEGRTQGSKEARKVYAEFGQITSRCCPWIQFVEMIVVVSDSADKGDGLNQEGRKEARDTNPTGDLVAFRHNPLWRSVRPKHRTQ